MLLLRLLPSQRNGWPHDSYSLPIVYGRQGNRPFRTELGAVLGLPTCQLWLGFEQIDATRFCLFIERRLDCTRERPVRIGLRYADLLRGSSLLLCSRLFHNNTGRDSYLDSYQRLRSDLFCSSYSNSSICHNVVCPSK